MFNLNENPYDNHQSSNFFLTDSPNGGGKR